MVPDWPGSTFGGLVEIMIWLKKLFERKRFRPFLIFRGRSEFEFVVTKFFLTELNSLAMIITITKDIEQRIQQKILKKLRVKK